MSTTQQSTQCLSGISADDPYHLIVRCLDLSVDGQLRSLAHLSGGCRLDQTTYRFPIGVICHLAGRPAAKGADCYECRTDMEQQSCDSTATVPNLRLCPCGKPLTGRADGKTCSPKCRQ
jgi:hypothetical protein